MIVEFEKVGEDLIPTITTKSIDDLGLTEEEKRFFVENIKDFGILLKELEGFEDSKKEYAGYIEYRDAKKAELPPLLSKSKSTELFLSLKETHDDMVREELILGHMRLVIYFSWYFPQIFPLSVEEIEQYGYEGLIKAVDLFDITKSPDFYSYAKNMIKTLIYENIKECLNIPFSRTKMPYFCSAKFQVEKRHGCSIQDDITLINEVVDNMIQQGDINPKSRDTLCAELRYIYNTDSLDWIINEEDDVRYQYDFDFYEIDKGQLNLLLEKLSPVQQRILRLRFGLDDGKEYSLEEIGEIVGVEKQRVSEIIKSTISRIHSSSLLRLFGRLYNDGWYKDGNPLENNRRPK